MARLTTLKAERWADQADKTHRDLMKILREARDVTGMAKGGDLSDAQLVTKHVSRAANELAEARTELQAIAQRVRRRKEAR